MIFQLQLLATAILTGVIWFVQLVQYPIFREVGPDAFQQYHKVYCERITWIVGPCMAVEVLTALLCWWMYPEGAHRYGLMLLAVIWISTAAVQVPIHNRLASGYCSLWGRRLVGSNWLRTLAWTARLLLLLSVVKPL